MPEPSAELRKQLDEGRVLWPDQARRLLDENERLREALEQITHVWPNRGHAANIAREALYG